MDETVEYFKTLSSMLPKIIEHDNSSVISKKYSHNPSSDKKRKLKTAFNNEGDNGRLTNKTESKVGKVKPISVENIPSLNIIELKERLYQKMEESRGNQKIKDKKREKLKAKRKEMKNQTKANIKVNKPAPTIVTTAVQKSQNINEDKKSDTKIQFSKFESNTKEDVTLSAMKKRKKKKDLSKMLAEAKEEKKKVKSLQKSTDEVDSATLNEKSWKKALSMAKGEKQKDNPELIVKTIKRKEQSKKKSAKEWSKRIGGQKKVQKAQQKKRQENIEKRKESKKKR